jgi:hypothetical protein
MKKYWLALASILLVGLVCVGTSKEASASAGCDQVNAGTWNGTFTFNIQKVIAGFAVGDTLSFTVGFSSSGPPLWERLDTCQCELQ